MYVHLPLANARKHNKNYLPARLPTGRLPCFPRPCAPPKSVVNICDGLTACSGRLRLSLAEVDGQVHPPLSTAGRFGSSQGPLPRARSDRKPGQPSAPIGLRSAGGENTNTTTALAGGYRRAKGKGDWLGKS